MQKNETTDANIMNKEYTVCENDPYRMVILHKMTMDP